MSDTNRKLLVALLIADGLLLFAAAIFGSKVAILNTQIGFLSATLVMLGSMKSYRRMIDARVEHKIITTDIDKDVIDKIEDPHDLYSEDTPVEEPEDLRSAIKEERARLKQNRRSIGEVLRDSKGAFSAYRLGAYVLLVLGFLYLNRHGILQIPLYLLALSLPPFIVVGILVWNKESDSEDRVE